VLVIAGIAVFVAAFFFRQSTPSASAAAFFDALARGDAETLAEYTYLEGKDEAQIREEWEYATDVSEYYRFVWDIAGQTPHSDDSATVRLNFIRNVDQGGSYEEIYQVPMTLVGDTWKVDLSQTTREIYPAMPR
jgi:hypothetical protein